MRSFIVTFRKNVTSLGFWLCVGMTILLLFAAEIYFDFGTQTRYSVFRALTDFSRSELANHFELCSITVIQNARGGWFTLFAPIIAAFCFVPTMCAEREQNAVRFQIFRTKKLNFHISQFLSGVISGGFAMALGYIIFAAAAFALFPSVSEMNSAEMLQGANFNLLELTLGVWLFGAFWSIPAMFLTSVLRNKYIILCIPFFVKYGLNQTYQKVFQDAVSSEKFDKNLLEIANLINPNGLLWITDSTRLSVSLVFGISSILLFCAYLIVEQKRGDCGA